jgi:2'-5' RNA ligase
MKYIILVLFLGFHASIYAGEHKVKTKMQNFSVWLIPAQKDFDYFGAVIDKLAREQGVPAFRPHVTIFVGQTDSLSRIEQVLKVHANLSTPIVLKITGVDVTEMKYKSLFVTLENSEQLAKLSSEIGKNAFNNDYQFRPHLSLLYKDMPLNEKKALQKQFNLKLSTITFDKIELIREDDPDDVSKWIPVFVQGYKGINH